MRTKTLTLEATTEIQRVALARAHLPTDIELARAARVSRRRIQQVMKMARDAFMRSEHVTLLAK